MVAWNKLSGPYLAAGSYFDDVLRNLTDQNPAFLPPLGRSARLFVTSDFAGEHPASRFITFSLVLTPVEAIRPWAFYRHGVRKRFGLDSRKFAYSKFNDQLKQEAMTEFCLVSNSIHGLSVTVLIDKRIRSIFGPGRNFLPSDIPIGGKTFSRWKAPGFERVLRAAYFVSLFVAGTSSPGQDVAWISDADAIAPNELGLADLTYIFAAVLTHIAPHRFGNVGVATTETAIGDRLAIEDLAAIPDLVGGAVNEVVGSFRSAVPLYSFVALAPDDLPEKTKRLVRLLFDERAPLRKLVFTVEPEEGTQRLIFGCPRMVVQPRLVRL
jgi:hypothetical protein